MNKYTVKATSSLAQKRWFLFFYSSLHLYRVLTRHTLLKVVNKLIPFSVIFVCFFFSLLNIATIYKAYVHFVLSVRKLINLQISAHCRYTTWRNLTTSRKGRPKALGTANRIGWENNKQQKQWTLKRESLVPGRTNETGGWNLARFPAAVQETSPRSSPSLLRGDPRQRRRSSPRDGNQKRDKDKD